MTNQTDIKIEKSTANTVFKKIRASKLFNLNLHLVSLSRWIATASLIPNFLKYVFVSKYFKEKQQELKEVNMGTDKNVKNYLLVGLWLSIIFYHTYGFFILGQSYKFSELDKIIQLSITILLSVIYLDTK